MLRTSILIVFRNTSIVLLILVCQAISAPMSATDKATTGSTSIKSNSSSKAALSADAPVSSPITLFDFETEDQIAAWTANRKDFIFERSTEQVNSGSYSAKVTFKPSEPAVGYPQAYLNYNPPMDWSFFGSWQAKIFVAEGSFAHDLVDADGTRWWSPLQTSTGQWVNVELPLDGGIDLTQVARDWFYTGPGGSFVFYIDDIRLINPNSNWLKAFVSRLPQPLPGPVAQAVQPWRKKLIHAVEEGLAGYNKLTLHAAHELRTRLEQYVVEAHKAARIALSQEMAATAIRLYPKARYGVGILDSADRPFVRDRWFPARVVNRHSLQLAIGETEAFQVVVNSATHSLSGCRVTVGPLVGPTGATLRSPQVSVVGSFLTGRAATYPVDYKGYHADVLLPYDMVDIPAGDFQSFWVSIETSSEQTPGIYRGEVVIDVESEASVVLPLTVEVWPFALSRIPSMDTALSFSAGDLQEIYGERTNDMVRPYARFILKNRIDFTNLYGSLPCDIDILQELSSSIRPFKFNIINLERTYADVATSARSESLPNEWLAQHYIEAAAQRATSLVPDLEKRGLLKQAYIYGFDEMDYSSAKAAADIVSLIRKKTPDIPILTTASSRDYGYEDAYRNLNLMFCPTTGGYNANMAAKSRKSGNKVWWYFCQGVKQPIINWYLQYPLSDVRILFGPMAARYRPDGVLYWTINCWTGGGISKPIQGGPLFSIAPGWKGDHGEGILLYPGQNGPLSSLRLENVRDGLEDYEYYVLLERLVGTFGNNRKTRNATTESLIASAKQILKVNPRVVASQTHYTRDSTLLRNERKRLAKTIIALQKMLDTE